MSGYYHRELAGVGGWLTFFLIIIGVLTPLRAIFETIGLHTDPEIAAAFGDAWTIIAPLEWALTALQLGILWYMVWRLLKVQVWQTVRVVIAGIWISTLGIPVMEIVAISVFAAFPLEQLFANVAIELVRSLIFGAIWTAYFLRSERVANTYLRQDNPEEMAEVFN